MRKNIPTKLKTILALGVLTLTTASSAVNASALSLENNVNTSNKNLVYSNTRYKFSAKPNCSIKPELKPDKDNSCKDKNHSDKNCNNTNKPDNNKPESNKPDDNNNSDSTDKPNDNNNSGSTSENFSAYQKEVVDLVNIERSKAGLNPLTLDSSISNVATKKSQDMIDNNYFSHNSPTYGSPFDMLKKFGISYKTAGENIAMGQKTPKEVVNAWMNSEGHRKNIMNPNFSKIGVGVAQKSGGSIYWTQIFVG
ncbi:CAP domain-containing protein [Clostridioides difficile]|uniref:CAP domain-containing protein n=1 Tax=Clostridioides difficile TaxID=1496 RepID=UPI0010BAEC49|nr:CAP domain-containing protein [Clostridioides difficile]MCE0684298.1 CAP domain-containing protein [Clostridioides difficile]MCE0694542.1 CAP domain-containing protein [Clostridioides difficile]MCE0700537.1 CAP domain-containing protein [Clostridioides difficile]MCE0708156.1 CAP domain-containing protein [Clostridioides difficile]MCE0717607.1 CAP domain-containing protein [Clostridioides difficile]